MKKAILTTLHVVSFILFFTAIILIIVNWSSLPDQVPTHYNVLGEADSWGPKAFIFFLPLFGLAMWGFLGFLKNPRFINMPGLGDTPNKKQMDNALLLIQLLRVELFMLTCLMSLIEIYNSTGGSLSLGVWEMVTFFTVILGTTLFFTIRGFLLKAA